MPAQSSSNTGDRVLSAASKTSIRYSPIPQNDAANDSVEGSDKQQTASAKESQSMANASPTSRPLKIEDLSSPTVNRRRFEQSSSAGNRRDGAGSSLPVWLLPYLLRPRTILLVVEFIMAILALSAAVDSPHLISVFCADNIGTFVKYGYPYRMNHLSLSACQNSCMLTRGDRCSPAAQFFVFVCVVSFVASASFYVIFIWYRHSSTHLNVANLADLCTCGALSVAWFAGSIAWSAAVTEIRQITRQSYIKGMLQNVENFENCQIFAPSNGSLVVSIILGFCNCALWIVSCLLAFRNSKWLKGRGSHVVDGSSSPASNSPQNIEGGK